MFNEEEVLSQLRNERTKRRAFEKIVAHYNQALYWQIRKFVIFHDDADDVLQNTFLKAWTNIDSFRGESKLSTWLYKIAYNESIIFLNKQRKTISLEGNEEDDLTIQIESDSYFDGDHTEALFNAAIASLPEKQRAVFLMKYYEEKKYEEISQITGTSIGALKASYHIAVKKIEAFFNSHD